VRDQPALAVAGAANIDGGDDIAVLDEIGVGLPVAAAAFVLAVRQILEQDRVFLAGPAAGWVVKVRRQPDSVRH
jgi:hypothetical protein